EESNLSILPYTITIDIRNTLSLFEFSALIENYKKKNGDTIKTLFITVEQYFIYPEKRSGKREISISNHYDTTPSNNIRSKYKKVLMKLYDNYLYQLHLRYWRKNNLDRKPSNSTEIVNLDPANFLVSGNEIYLPGINISPGYVTVIAGSNTL